MGVRHMDTHTGLWLQPEPYLYMGPWNGDLANPKGLFGPYAYGDPVNAGKVRRQMLQEHVLRVKGKF